MAEETPNNAPAETPADEPRGSAAYTDDQLAQAFPGQDISHVRSMLDKAAGVGVPSDPHEGGAPNDADGNRQQANAADSADGEGEGDGETVWPDFIPEKFRKGTVEEAMQKLAESYTVLERARGGDNSADGDAGDGVADSGDGAADDSDEEHLDLRTLEAEFVKNGSKMTEEMYAKAEKAGLDRGTVDAFIEGQQAIAQQLVTKVHDMVGGPESYESMLKWMVGNLPEAEVAAYDEAMGTGNAAKIAVAVRGVHAAYQAAVGSDPGRRVQPKTGTPTEPGFKSKREMIDAMKDPRYQKDEAYRQEVAKRIQNGNVW